MTEKNKRVSKIWVASFAFSRGFLDEQDIYLRKHLTAEELQITSEDLLNDPDARPMLIQAYRKLPNIHNFTDAAEQDIANEIRKQINLARSLVIHGALGYIDD